MTENKKNNKFIDVKPAALLAFIFMTACFILLYTKDFKNILIRWDDSDLSYCYLVPFVFLYLVYLKKDLLSHVEQKSSYPGLVLLIVSGVIYIGGRQGSIETLTYISIWLSIISVFLILFGSKVVKNLAFPFVILGFIVPVPPYLNRMFTFKLKLISSYLSVKVMQLFGLSVFGEGNIIDLGVTKLQVVDACSGLRYVYPLMLMGFIFACIFNKKWWERLIVIVSTIPISVISNSLRIAITGYLTLKVSPDVAEGFFHGFSGWLIFMVSFIILALFSFLMKKIRIRIYREQTFEINYQDNKNIHIDLRRTSILFIWLAAIIMAGFWGLNAMFVSSQFTPARKSFETFPVKVGDWEGYRRYLSDEIMEELWADDYIQIQFQNTETRDYILFFVPYYGYQNNRHTAHAPASCLVGSGYAPVSKKVITRKFPSPFGDVEIGQMILEKNSQKLLSNFWFHGRGRVVASEYLNKWDLFLDSITKRRTDGALVRIEMPLRKGQSVEEAQKVMDDFTLKMLKYLPEYVPE